MRFVYPSLSYHLRTVYPLWAPEYEWARAHGLAVGLVDVDEERRWLPAPPAGPTPVVYRGWMPTALQLALTALRPRLFYSFDVAETLTGQPVLIEVGDGQVSDLKEWSVIEFGCRVLRALAAANDNL